MKEFRIADEVYVSVDRSGAVFLDVVHDRYTGVSSTQLRGMSGIVSDWPASSVGEDVLSAAEETNVFSMVESLMAQGLLTRSPRRDKPVLQVQLARPSKSISADGVLEEPDRICTHHILNIVCAYLAAVFTLKVISLSCALRRLAASAANRPRGGAALDLATARRLVAIFKRLRPLLYTAKSACLLDSIVLIRFLAAYKIHPAFVIGVTSEPFGAHCWCQHGDIVFNEEPAYAEQFSPILCIR